MLPRDANARLTGIRKENLQGLEPHVEVEYKAFAGLKQIPWSVKRKTQDKGAIGGRMDGCYERPRYN